jgi:hypothetical protein
MSTRATPEYLRTIRTRPGYDLGTGAKCTNSLYISDGEWQNICAGDTPKSLPPAMIVSKAEFVRERIYPWHDQVLHDYRVHYKDGTYDCISITPVMARPTPEKFWSRVEAHCGGDFVTWEEASS